jgi:putative component of membrane protein insertase Oxa1/YidC/SpoIIIJ protein YidD
MRSLALLVIRAYQRFVSPYKGFCCAYKVHTGRASCSALGYRAIRRHGVLSGLVILRRRTSLCGIAHRRCFVPAPRHHMSQRGDCDLPCDLPCDAGCDFPDHCGARKLSDFVSCCDCGSCDWPSKDRRRSTEREKDVHIPPKTGRAPRPPRMP